MSERADKWLNLHGVVQRMDDAESDDGLFGGTDGPDDDTLVSEIQRLVRRDKSPPKRVSSPIEPH
jgi:hypothetical protein